MAPYIKNLFWGEKVFKMIIFQHRFSEQLFVFFTKYKTDGGWLKIVVKDGTDEKFDGQKVRH